jgi:hypothetical protein
MITVIDDSKESIKLQQCLVSIKAWGWYFLQSHEPWPPKFWNQNDTTFTFLTRITDRGVGVRVPEGDVVQTGSEAHPASYLMSTVPFSPRVKLQGREADHSPPATAEVNKMWIYTSIPPYAFMV